jgi:hypothetical protein
LMGSSFWRVGEGVMVVECGLGGARGGEGG